MTTLQTKGLKLHERSRGIIERIYITGMLTLESPAHFGNGDTDAITDIPLLWDSLDSKKPLLTGTSIAGALRNYLREYQVGYGIDEKKNGELLAEKLFGHLIGDRGSTLSWLIVDDAIGTIPKSSSLEIRDGVVIDPKTRTAKVDKNGKGKKFDIELLPAGTEFLLRFELLIPKNDTILKEAAAIALKGLEDGRIGLGMRKRRGYGECKVTSWHLISYSMDTRGGLIGWLTHSDVSVDKLEKNKNIFYLIGVVPQQLHKGKKFEIDATFSLMDSLLIRSSAGEGEAADALHLRSWRKDVFTPVLSGTSLAGAIRSRALRIAQSLKVEQHARKFIDNMFGKQIESHEDIPSGSNVFVYEGTINNGILDRVQTRVKIDRFTAGAFPAALYSEQPVFSGHLGGSQVKIRIELRKTPQNEKEFDAQIGLLLLVFKDLWTGDLPVGGESSIGRGRLQGIRATMTFNDQKWRIEKKSEAGLLIDGPSDELEKFVRTFWEAE